MHVELIHHYGDTAVSRLYKNGKLEMWLDEDRVSKERMKIWRRYRSKYKFSDVKWNQRVAWLDLLYDFDAKTEWVDVGCNTPSSLEISCQNTESDRLIFHYSSIATFNSRRPQVTSPTSECEN